MNARELMRNLMTQRRGAYRACFEGNDQKLHPMGQIVLADLFHISGQGKSVAVGRFDPSQLLIQEGKRQLYLHIVSMLRANDEDLWRAAQDYVKQFGDGLAIRREESE